MCHHYSNAYGYLCDECYEELHTYLKNKGLGLLKIYDFMEIDKSLSEDLPYNMVDQYIEGKFEEI